MNFKPHDRVVIGGRTMLAPGHSLVGLEATVFAVGGYLPAGIVQVAVDGEVVEDEGGSRVLLANIPSTHLEYVNSQKTNRGDTMGAALSAVPSRSGKSDAGQSFEKAEGGGSSAPPDDDKPATSGLRLV